MGGNMQEQAEAKNFDEIVDELFNKEEKETPTDSSSENKQEDSQTQGQDTGTEPAKSEQVKAVEDDESLTVEQKIEKIKDLLGDDEKAIDAYIKQKGYHNDPAWQKQRELIDRLKEEAKAKTALSDEDKSALEEFKKFRSSAEYIQTSMKAQGYTQEAINKKLQESGFDVSSEPQDDVKFVLEKLGVKSDSLNADQKAMIEDVVRISDILINDRLGKVLPKQLAPIQEHIGSITKSENASKMVNTMKDTIKGEGILDFEKDIEPELNKFMDDNPDATQQDVLEHFKVINHKLTVERLKTGNKKGERDEKKNSLRQNISVSSSGNLPKKTGNFDKDADAFLDSLGV